MQLTKGMYGTEFQPSGDTTFGLRTGQMRGHNQLTHNSGWYNGRGEKLGFGDLNDDDMLRIMCDIEPGEVFVILSEGDSFWKFVQRPGLIGSMHETAGDIEAPGVDYVAAKAHTVITSEGVFYVDRRGDFKPGSTAHFRGLGEIPVISPDGLRSMLAVAVQ